MLLIITLAMVQCSSGLERDTEKLDCQFWLD